VEIASRWYEPQEHFSPAGIRISQAIRDTFKHLDLGNTAFGKAIGRPASKIVRLIFPKLSKYF